LQPLNFRSTARIAVKPLSIALIAQCTPEALRPPKDRPISSGEYDVSHSARYMAVLRSQ
jgi:hypothetical protein